MKQFNNFNEMFNSQVGSSISTHIFNSGSDYVADFVAYVVERFKDEKPDYNTLDADTLYDEIDEFISYNSLDGDYCNDVAECSYAQAIDIITELGYYDWEGYDLEIHNINQVAYAAVDEELRDYGWDKIIGDCIAELGVYD